MPAKIARLATRPPFWIPEVSVAVRSSRPSCSKAEKREYSWQIGSHPGNPGQGGKRSGVVHRQRMRPARRLPGGSRMVYAVLLCGITFLYKRLEEGLMRKLTMTLTVAAFVLGSMALTVNAQTQQTGAAGVHGLAQNATPIVKQAACRGWGRHCPPGRHWVCGPYHCWCRWC